MKRGFVGIKQRCRHPGGRGERGVAGYADSTRIESMPGCLSDYREWLRKKGIDTTGMRPMGSAESRMSVFAYRVKHRRSWSHRGLKAFLHVFIAVKDALPIRTRKGDQVSVGEPTERKQMIIRKAKSRARANVPETIRNNFPYLRWSSVR